MLPDGGVGSSAPACWYNSVVEESSPSELLSEVLSVEQVSAAPTRSPSVIEDQENREDHIAHIEKLAQPKKSCLTDKPFPARLYQKKKVVAFGRTVNYSQTVEGTSRRDHIVNKVHPPMNRTVENKENKPPPGVPKVMAKEISKRKSMEPAEKTTEHEGITDIGSVKELLQKNEEKNEALFAQVFKKLEELTMVQRQEPPKQDDFIRRPLAEKKPEALYRTERARILDSIERHLECDPTFINELVSFCKTMENRVGFVSPTPTDDFVRPAHRPTVSRSAVATTRERNEVTRQDRSGAFVTERMTVERSFMSPGGEPFSVDSRKFLGNRGLIKGASDRNLMSPPQSRGVQNPPQSYYQPGYSVAYVPQRSLAESSDDENCGTVLQLTDAQYEKQCAAREAKLRSAPFITEVEDQIDLRNATPDERKRREVQRQLEEKRRRRDEMLKK